MFLIRSVPLPLPFFTAKCFLFKRDYWPTRSSRKHKEPIKLNEALNIQLASCEALASSFSCIRRYICSFVCPLNTICIHAFFSFVSFSLHLHLLIAILCCLMAFLSLLDGKQRPIKVASSTSSRLHRSRSSKDTGLVVCSVFCWPPP